MKGHCLGPSDRCERAHLEFFLVKDPQLFERHNLLQALFDRGELRLDSSFQAMLAQQIDVLELVVLRHGNVGASRLELKGFEGSERLVL